MKTKTKFVVSIFALTLIFTACKKDAVTPEPVLDCMEVVNGVAVIDSCGDCQQAYIYNYVSHDVEYLDDTTGTTLVGTTMLVMPEDAGNPYWNAGCK